MNNDGIGLLGAGGHADEVSATHGNVLFRAVSNEYLGSSGMVDIENPGTAEKTTAVHIAVGSPAVRKKLRNMWPGSKFASVISRHAVVEETATLGEGVYVAHGAVITTNVVVGDHVIMGVNSSVHHGCKIEDYVTISPGVRVGGNTHLKAGAFVGIGAVIINGITVASGAVIGAGAVVINDCVEENGVYVGNPARLIKVNKDWLNEI